MKIGITCYPTYGGSGAVATELGIALAQARPRGPLHHVPAAVPAAVVPAARLLPRSRRRPLSAVRVSAVRPRARGADARSGARRTGSTCCTCTTRFRTRPARGSRARCCTSGRRHRRASRRCTARTSRSSGRIPRSTRSRSSRSRSRIGITAVSRYLRDETIARSAAPACEVEVIPNFIDPRSIRPRAQHAPCCASSSPASARC